MRTAAKLLTMPEESATRRLPRPHLRHAAASSAVASASTLPPQAYAQSPYSPPYARPAAPRTPRSPWFWSLIIGGLFAVRRAACSGPSSGPPCAVVNGDGQLRLRRQPASPSSTSTASSSTPTRSTPSCASSATTPPSKPSSCTSTPPAAAPRLAGDLPRGPARPPGEAQEDRRLGRVASAPPAPTTSPAPATRSTPTTPPSSAPSASSWSGPTTATSCAGPSSRPSSSMPAS